jgi:hypothetical protein
MKERDGMIMDAMSAHPRLMEPRSEYCPMLNGSRIVSKKNISAPFHLDRPTTQRLGINGAPSVNFLVDVVFEISDSDRWSASTDKRFIKQLPP